MLTSEIIKKRPASLQKEFQHTGEPFSAYQAAKEWLGQHGYQWGTICKGYEEIAVKNGLYMLPQKWENFYKADKARIDGLMLSKDYEKSKVKVIIF